MKKTFPVLFFIIIFSTFCFVYGENINISSNAAVAMDADSGIVLYEKNMNEKIYPASTTKILTAILALENLNLSDTLVVSKTAIAIPWDSSSIYLKKGEVLTVEELLYGMLLNSGNDAANVLGEAVSQNLKDFAKLMNEKAKEIGCTNTHFTNAHGYSDDNHYTTALDMAKILSYCIRNEKFVEIISTKSYIINETNKTNEKRYLTNTNRLIQTKEDSIYSRFYEYCIGGKTGYTDESGRTLVTIGKKDNKYVIVTIFGADSEGTLDKRYTDAINLFEYSFNNFEKRKIADKENFKFKYINMEKELVYDVGTYEDFEILANDNSVQELNYNINIADKALSEFTIDSIPNNEVVGTILFNITTSDGNTYSIYKDLHLSGINKYSKMLTEYKIEIAAIIISILSVIALIAIVVIIYKNKKKSPKTDLSRKKRRI